MSTISQILESKGYDKADQAEIVESGYAYYEGLDQQVRSHFNMTEPIYFEDGEYLIGEADEEIMTEIAKDKGFETCEDLLSAMDKHLIALAEDFPAKEIISHRRRIGERIKSLREEEGMTQGELADACGLQRQNIARIEHGKYSVGQDILSKIATALGKTLDIV